MKKRNAYTALEIRFVELAVEDAILATSLDSGTTSTEMTEPGATIKDAPVSGNW